MDKTNADTCSPDLLTDSSVNSKSAPRQVWTFQRHHWRELESRTYSKIFVSVQEHLPPTLSTDILRDLLKLARRALLLYFSCSIRDLVLEEPGSIRPPPHQKLGIILARINNSLFDVLMDGRLHGTHESRTHVNPTSTQTERCSEGSAIRHATGSDIRDSFARLWVDELFSRTVEQNKVWNVVFSDMATTFEAVDAEEVHTHFDCGDGVADGSAFVEDDTACGLEFGDVLFDQTGRLDNLDALVDDCLSVLAVWWRVDGGQNCEINSERFVCHFSCLRDLLS